MDLAPDAPIGDKRQFKILIDDRILLRDKGFPQQGLGNTVDVGDGTTAYTPTITDLLRECLELCPDFKLHCYHHGFVIERAGLTDMEICESPKRALMNLWLELKK